MNVNDRNIPVTLGVTMRAEVFTIVFARDSGFADGRNQKVEEERSLAVRCAYIID